MAACPLDACSTLNDIESIMSAMMVRAYSLSSTTSIRRPRRSGSGNKSRFRLFVFPTRTVNQKLDPFPGSDSTPISPPIISTSFLEMAKPSPVPPNFRVVVISACWKDSKRRPRCSGVSPIPVSLMVNLRSTSLPKSLCLRPITATSPFSVNFTALPSRLMSTCPIRNGSPLSVAGMDGSMSNTSSKAFSSALPRTKPETSFSIASTSNTICSISNLPASILEISRISLMIPSRWRPELWILSR